MWKKISNDTPPENVPVKTKIEDPVTGVSRNEQVLVYWNKLWWDEKKTMYVYYTPTHWKPL